jgi:hypothetical protein
MTDFPALADVTLQPNNESFVVSLAIGAPSDFSGYRLHRRSLYRLSVV